MQLAPRAFNRLLIEFLPAKTGKTDQTEAQQQHRGGLGNRVSTDTDLRDCKVIIIKPRSNVGKNRHRTPGILRKSRKSPGFG